MRSIAKLLATLLYWTFEAAAFLVLFSAVRFAFNNRWGLTGVLAALWLRMRFELEKIREWAEKF